MSTGTKGRNLNPYNRFDIDGVEVLASDHVVNLGNELVITLPAQLRKKLKAQIHQIDACDI